VSFGLAEHTLKQLALLGWSRSTLNALEDSDYLPEMLLHIRPSTFLLDIETFAFGLAA
jgi:DNA-binding XRE family transcriptional regulator